jgi:anti-sigma factor RsiW
MVFAFFKIRYAKSRMVAYVNGELPPAARRRMARYIEQYPVVYTEYLHQRNAVRELEWKLPLVGQAEKPTLDRMWSAIQSELHQTPPRRSMRLPNFSLRYGVVAFATVLAFALPLSYGGSRTAFALSISQPAPMTATTQPANTATLNGKHIAVLISATEQVEVTPPAPALPRATPVGTDED